MSSEAFVPEIERARAIRVAENQRQMEALGLGTAVANVQAAAARAPRAPTAPRQPKPAVIAGPPRRSERERAAVSYSDDAAFGDLARLSRGPSGPRGPPRVLGEEEVLKLREQNGVAASTSGRDEEGGGRVGRAIDSGRGVRIQGGKVYDSTFGVTCHWCRQKTIEDKVTCCNSSCGGGHRLPTTFCGKCLLNRQGEDAGVARESGTWECPQCRISCGAGCLRCCNCGPCRKKAGVEPTGHVVHQARSHGFDNVHDYLVHQVTGETAEKIHGRKRKHAWGAWVCIAEIHAAQAAEAAGGPPARDALAAAAAAAASPAQVAAPAPLAVPALVAAPAAQAEAGPSAPPSEPSTSGGAALPTQADELPLPQAEPRGTKRSRRASASAEGPSVALPMGAPTVAAAAALSPDVEDPAAGGSRRSSRRSSAAAAEAAAALAAAAAAAVKTAALLVAATAETAELQAAAAVPMEHVAVTVFFPVVKVHSAIKAVGKKKVAAAKQQPAAGVRVSHRLAVRKPVSL